MCWIVPPEPAVLPLPVTVRPPALPVLISEMPRAGPELDVPAEIDWKLSPDAPIVVL